MVPRASELINNLWWKIENVKAAHRDTISQQMLTVLRDIQDDLNELSLEE